MTTQDLSQLADAVPLRLTFQDDDPGFSVVEAEATLALSQMFEVRIVVQHTDANIKLRSLLRRTVRLNIDGEAFVKVIEGILRRARTLSVAPTGVTRYELILVPPMWLLTRRRNHRIFRGLSVPQIVETILQDHPPALSKLAGSFENPHAARDYTVQYGEDDAHAVSRLLADEGIVSIFAVAAGSELVLVDNTITQTPSLPSPLAYVPPGTDKPNTPHVIDFEPSSEISLRRAAIRDYDYKKPSFIIEGDVPQTDPADADLEHYEYEVGEVADPQQARTRAQTTLLAESQSRAIASCLTSDLIPPGTRFFVSGGPREESDGELLVVSSRSLWTTGAIDGAPASRHELVCMSTANAFKPRRLEKPRIAGVQTGLVVGADGKEIDVDEEGRVEVEFRWDRRDLHALGASRRVRVSQSWAGVGYGLVTHPRVGDEVVVAYLDGDPDQPIIVGRVHNPVRPSPLKLPGDETVSVWRSRSSPGGDGYNQILMDDLAGKERLEMHAQRDFKQVVERDSTIVVQRDESRTVHGDHVSRTTGTGDIDYQSGFSFKTAAKGFIGAHFLEINTGGRDDRTASAYNHYADSVFYHVNSVFMVGAPHVVIEAGESIRLLCGGSEILLEPGGISIKSSGPVNINGSRINLNC